jgi:phage terminase small subunit
MARDDPSGEGPSQEALAFRWERTSYEELLTVEAVKMNSKQQAFVEAYCCNGFNATQAAITAGYSEKTAESQASRLLTNVKIKEAVDAFKAKASKKALVTMEDVVNGLLLEATSNGEGCTQSARVAAWKALTDFTGGFDANVKKVAVDTDVAFNMNFNGEKGDE